MFISSNAYRIKSYTHNSRYFELKGKCMIIRGTENWSYRKSYKKSVLIKINSIMHILYELTYSPYICPKVGGGYLDFFQNRLHFECMIARSISFLRKTNCLSKLSLKLGVYFSSYVSISENNFTYTMAVSVKFPKISTTL